MELLQSTDEFDIIAGNTNAVGEVTTWYTFVFDEPYMAAAGDWLGAGFEHYGGSNVQYGESKFTQDQHSIYLRTIRFRVCIRLVLHK